MFEAVEICTRFWSEAEQLLIVQIRTVTLDKGEFEQVITYKLSLAYRILQIVSGIENLKNSHATSRSVNEIP